MSDGLPVDPKSLGWGPAPSKEARPADEGENAEGLSVICRECGTLTAGVIAGNRVRWVTCAACFELRGRAAVGDDPAPPTEYERALWNVISGWSFHDDECPSTTEDTDDICNCGYDEAMKAAHREHKALRRVPPGRDTPTGGDE